MTKGDFSDFNDTERYRDIIDLPHPELRHPRMAAEARAAQFSPFAALTGYDEAVHEVARWTDSCVELDADETAVLDRRLRILRDHGAEAGEVSATYFVPDARKAGGAYRTVRGTVKKVDTSRQCLVLATADGEFVLPLAHLRALESECFAQYGSDF